ncbi:hypothetical protein [Paenibacillus sp. FSL P4-0184]
MEWKSEAVTFEVLVSTQPIKIIKETRTSTAIGIHTGPSTPAV